MKNLFLDFLLLTKSLVFRDPLVITGKYLRTIPLYLQEGKAICRLHAPRIRSPTISRIAAD